jgi:hypothetical protein
MNPRNSRVLVFAVALLAVPLLPAWSQSPTFRRPQPVTRPAQPKEPAVVIKETPIEEGDPQGQQAQDPNAAQPAQDPNAAAQGQPTQNPGAAQGQQGQGQGITNAPGTLSPQQIGIAFAPPQGWQQGDATKFSVPGSICCVWSPDNVSSIALFVQNSGKPYNPRVLLDQSAEGLQKSLGAEVRTKEVVTVGGMRGFSLVVSGQGTGAGIDGKGTVRTTQHWIAVPRDKDVVIFLMTTPDEKFAANEQTFQSMLASMKLSGTQTADQQAAK